MHEPWSRPSVHHAATKRSKRFWPRGPALCGHTTRTSTCPTASAVTTPQRGHLTRSRPAAELACRDVELGRMAQVIETSGAWRDHGHASFDDYCREHIGLSPSSVVTRMVLARRLATLPGGRTWRPPRGRADREREETTRGRPRSPAFSLWRPVHGNGLLTPPYVRVQSHIPPTSRRRPAPCPMQLPHRGRRGRFRCGCARCRPPERRRRCRISRPTPPPWPLMTPQR